MSPAIAAMGALALGFGYFLLYAQFAFIELTKASVADPARIKITMAAMALSGIAGGFLAPRLTRRHGTRTVTRLAFLACSLMAALAPWAGGLAAFISVAAATGTALGLLTVSLAACLWQAIPRERGPIVAGLGTGLAYAFCNLPWVFQAPASHQSFIAAVLAAVGMLTMRWVGQDPQPLGRAETAACRSHLVSVVICFAALVWLDSAAFFIIQQNRELKLATWGAGDLWRNAVVHLTAALLAGWLIVRWNWRATIGLAFVILALAALMVDHEPFRRLAGWLYPAGASLYSAALMAWPAFLSGARGAEETARRAAWLYAIAGWVGSANGIGMAESQHRVPSLFVLLASVALLGGLSWRRFPKQASASLIILLLGIAFEALAIRQRPQSDVELGHQIYLREGCIHCHSRYVRPGSADLTMWGPPTPASTVAEESPPLIGNRRQGPDLAWVGARRSAAWLRLHFLEPRSFEPSSSMPSYARLFDGPEGNQLVAYLRQNQEPALAMHPATSRWVPKEEGSLGDGSLLFAQRCSVCHGAEGRGDGKWAKEFAKPPADLKHGPFAWTPTEGDEPLEHRLARVIKFGIQGTDMPGHETLSDGQVLALARWVLSLRAPRDDR